MSRLQIRLFGGFRVKWRDREIDSFESQKVRALLSYLAHFGGRSFSRDHLAGLLWPESTSDSSRRNLRQALYSLRRAICDGTSDAISVIRVTHQTVSLDPEAKVLVDTSLFHQSLLAAQQASVEDGLASLAQAIDLYTGDFLAGFHVKSCPSFEEWCLQEQEQQRENATTALRTLAQHQLDDGGYTLGIQYVHRLLKIDPLAEDAHRMLMRLHAISGRRGKAMKVFQDLRRLLEEELGVEPSEETLAHYQAIAEERITEPAVIAKAEPEGPMIPMVGREEAVERLRESWNRVRSGQGLVTFLVGEEGIGKTRLLRSTTHEATNCSPAIVLRGRFSELRLPILFDGFREALTNALTHEPDVVERVLAGTPPETLALLSALIPQIRSLQPHLPPTPEEAILDQLAEALAIFLKQLAGPSEPVILLLDDLQWADPASVEALRVLTGSIRRAPIWIIGTVEAGEAGALAGLPFCSRAVDGNHETIHLERLTEGDTLEIAGALVGAGQAAHLAEVLKGCRGLPLHLTELINLLWDRGALRAEMDGQMKFAPLDSSLDWLTAPIPPTLDSIIHHRLESLPTSTRRLLTLAVVAGDGFDAELLRSAEEEHESVVEIGLQLLLKRWLIRHILGYWADSRRDRDIALWATGPRRGLFEFIHAGVRRKIYRHLSPERRRVLHDRIARALEDRLEEDEDQLLVRLTHHHLRSENWSSAAELLRRVARRAQGLAARETAIAYLKEGLSALGQAREAKPTHLRHHTRWEDLRAELDQDLATLEARPSPRSEEAFRRHVRP